jgi:hypothetical protein
MRAFLNRPDHLARAAAEVLKWADATRMAAGTPLEAEVPAFTIDAGAQDRVAFLTDPVLVDRIVRTIEDVVAERAARLLRADANGPKPLMPERCLLCRIGDYF